jgi:hypothetical protein
MKKLRGDDTAEGGEDEEAATERESSRPKVVIFALVRRGVLICV